MPVSPAPSWPAPDDLLRSVFDVSLTAINLLGPVYGPGGELVDFTLEYLNPAGQRMLGLPERPDGTITTRFPASPGLLAFYRGVFESGEPGNYDFNYLADGLDNYFRLAATRSGNLLVVSLTETADQDRSAVEAALRESQTREQAAVQQLEAQVAEHTQELQAARTQTEQQRQLFEDLVLHAPGAIALLTGPDFVYELVNPSYERLFDDRVFLGRPLLEALPELTHRPVIERIRSVYATGEPYEGREVLVPLARTATGALEERYFDVNYHARSNETGLITGVVAYVTDVTSQVMARRQVLATQAQLRALFEQAPVAIAVFKGPEYIIEVANPLVAQLWGRTVEEVIERPLFDALPEVRDQGFKELLDQVVASGEPFVAQEVSAVLERAGKLETVYLNFVYQPLRDASGRITSVGAVATEVSEMVAIRRASESSAHQLRLITNALPVLIGYLDQEQKYRFANEAYRAWFNQEPAALLGRSTREIVGEAAYPRIKGYVQRALTGERVDFEVEMPFRPDFVRDIRTTYVPDVQHGRVVGCFTLVTDITDQMAARRQVLHLNDELQVANRQLTHTNVDLDNFIYTASHDLKSPISNIEGLLHALRHELAAPSPGDIFQLLDLMQDSVQRFKRTIDHLTDITKLQRAHNEPIASIDLAALIDAICLDLRPQFEATGAGLTVDVSGCSELAFSEKNLRSIVFNLLSNALKYRHPDRAPQVHLRCYANGPEVVLEIQDNGLGFDSTQQDKLFGMFERLHDHVEGSGLGLYMVKKMVENAGGRIEVDSWVNEGTVFRLHLPHNGNQLVT